MTPFVLDIVEFRKRYPGLTESVISDEQVAALWEVVNALLGDGKGNFIYPEPVNATILYAALCHLATLETSGRDQPSRLTSASEGSVSASFESVQMKSEAGAWWNLTQCGALFWVLTQRWRSACRFYAGSKYHPWG